MVLSKALAAANAPEKVTDDRSALRMPLAPEMDVGRRMALLVVVLGALQREHRESHEGEHHWTAAAHDECGGKAVDFVLCGVSMGCNYCRSTVLLTKSSGVSNGFGNGDSLREARM